MADFMVHFLICNVLICGFIGILLLMKRIFKNSLSNRMQYNLWFLLMGILAVPFLPSLQGMGNLSMVEKSNFLSCAQSSS